MLTQPCSVFQIMSQNWSTTKCRQTKSSGMILHCYLCNALCNFFIKINILKLKARNSSKKIVFSRVKNYFCDIACKFLIKFQTMWRHEIKEQTPQLTLLYCCRIVRSSHLRFSIKNVFLKISLYPQETLVFKSLF